MTAASSQTPLGSSVRPGARGQKTQGLKAATSGVHLRISLPVGPEHPVSAGLGHLSPSACRQHPLPLLPPRAGPSSSLDPRSGPLMVLLCRFPTSLMVFFLSIGSIHLRGIQTICYFSHLESPCEPIFPSTW